jgi:hypothetical protein
LLLSIFNIAGLQETKMEHIKDCILSSLSSTITEWIVQMVT